MVAESVTAARSLTTNLIAATIPIALGRRNSVISSAEIARGVTAYSVMRCLEKWGSLSQIDCMKNKKMLQLAMRIVEASDVLRLEAGGIQPARKS